MKPLIALVVDHPLRDLQGLVLLAHRLAKQGADVCLVPLNLLMAETFALAPDFLLMNNLRRTTEPVLTGCLASGIKYGMLDTEGGLYGDLSFFRSTFTDREDIRNGLSCNFLWGKKIHEFLLEQRLFRPEQMIVTGTPRFDFYSPRWRYYFEVEAAAAQKLILIPTKVAVSNPQGHSVEKEVELLTVKLGLDASMIQRWRDVGFEQIAATIEMVKRLARDFPNARFVLRPHPHERIETYADALAGLGNLDVIREGTIDHWILRSNLLIHRMCTTAVEAMMAGVPSIVPSWVPTAANAPDTEAVSTVATSYDKLRDLVASRLRGESITSEAHRRALDQIVEDWFHRMDGDAHARVAQRILEVVGKDVSPDARRSSAKRYFFRHADSAVSARGFAGRLGLLGAALIPWIQWGRLVYPHSRVWSNTTKFFSARQVQDILNAVERLESGATESIATPIARPAAQMGVYPSHYKGSAVFVTGSR
jgi:surface carbohydrate biosynthesis protein